MSITFNIDRDARWHVGERKELDIRVLDGNGLPVDLTGRHLTWRLARTKFSNNPYLIASTTLANLTIIPHEDDEYDVMSVAHIAVDPADYIEVPRAGRYRHELYDDIDNLVLSEGYAILLAAMNLNPVES